MNKRLGLGFIGMCGLAMAAVTATPEGRTAPPQGTRAQAGPRPGGEAEAPPEAATTPSRYQIPIRIDRRLSKGDIISRGARVDMNRDGTAEPDECAFSFGVEVALESGSRSVNLVKGPDCTVVVDDIQDANVIEPPGQAADASASRQHWLARLWKGAFPSLHAQSGNKRAYQNVMHYGFGGQWDILTEVWGNVDWTYTGTTASAFSMYGYCNAKSNITGWWMNGCWIMNRNWYATTTSNPPYVTDLTDGHFFWDPPPQGGSTYYIHVLSNRRSGTPSGIGTCQYWVYGSIVSGVFNNCQVGPI